MPGPGHHASPPGEPVNNPPFGHGNSRPGVNAGWLVIDISGRMSSSSPLYEYVPKISIDGGPLLALKPGPTTINLPAGRHHVVVGVGSTHSHSFHYGKAAATVNVWPGQATTLYYRAPWTGLSRGAIGPVPQEPPDRAIATCLLILVVVLILTSVLLVV